MKTSFDFQVLRRGAMRPSDDGEIALVDAGKAEGTIIAPNVGDYVQLLGNTPEYKQFSGVVKSRLFRYFVIDDEVSCHINIVVEEVDVNWGLLIKE